MLKIEGQAILYLTQYFPSVQSYRLAERAEFRRTTQMFFFSNFFSQIYHEILNWLHTFRDIMFRRIKDYGFVRSILLNMGSTP